MLWPPLTQLIADANPAGTDGEDGPLVEKIAHRPLQFGQQPFETVLFPGTGLDLTGQLEVGQIGLGCGRDGIGIVELALDDQDGRLGAGHGAHKVQPVGQRTVAEDEPLVGDGDAGFHVGVPEDHVDRVLLQEQGVGAVVDVLSAEVPDVEVDGFFSERSGKRSTSTPWVLSIDSSKSRPHRRRRSWVLPTPPLPSRNSLSSASAAVWNSASAKWAWTLSRTFSFQLAAQGWIEVVEGATVELEFRQMAQQRTDWRELFQLPAVAQVEGSEPGEPAQRLHARQLLAPLRSREVSPVSPHNGSTLVSCSHPHRSREASPVSPRNGSTLVSCSHLLR